ncbi:MAG: ATP-binding protein [Deinococcus sp.]|nr:ATP-binding protein [Deinococcus sp.]
MDKLLCQSLEAAWEKAREGLVIFVQGKALYLNPSAASLLGVERDRAIGQGPMLVLRDHRLEELVHQTGETRLNVRGRVLLARAEGGILFLQDQTAEANRLEALEESSRVLAHELRTPVAGMMALLEALVQGVPEKESRQILELLYQEAERLKRLLEDLPLYRLPTAERTFNLEELCPRLERFLGLQLAERGAFIHWQASITVRASQDAVYQALLNLLENAIKYGPGGEIAVVSGSGEGEVWLEVRDKGKPLPEYEPLFQSGQRGVHAAGARGTGLGLTLVRRLSAGWGGRAYGRACEGGNAFGVTFPVANPEAKAQD